VLILFHAAIAGLLRLAETGLFTTRLHAFCLLPRAPACLLRARSATFGADAGIDRAGLPWTAVAEDSALFFPVRGLYIGTAGLSRPRGFRPLAIFGNRNTLFS
jgi:hypothetical protein